MEGAPRRPQLLDLIGCSATPGSGRGAAEYSTHFGENHSSWLRKQLANVRLCEMMKFSSHHRGQGYQRVTDATAPPNREKRRKVRRVDPQARQVQHIVRPRRQRKPSVEPLHVRHWPGAVSNSQPHVQHTHLVTAPAAFCTSAPSVGHPQTRQWACCHPVTRQSMNRLWPQRTHSQIMTGFSRLGTRRHKVGWPHGSQRASWGLKYGSGIRVVFVLCDGSGGNGIGWTPRNGSEAACNHGIPA